MLKLLAIQVLKGCAEHIYRCLEPELMYYLCHDYEISWQEKFMWHITKRDGYVNAIDNKFYRIHSDSQLNINISAVVGENGSGKSTLVELILRMINNAAIHFGIRAEEGRLEYVNGVHARLFYMIGDTFYCLSMEGNEESIKAWEIAKEVGHDTIPSLKPLTSTDLKGNFFYTLVSNYSHYAYNTHDFKKEWQKQTDEDTCWLKWLFHKNDGYQTPITLHPFRDQGTISIEREKNLSNQRLLYFFINYAKQKNEKGVFEYINGKRPKYLNLRKVKISKLQQTTLLGYMRQHRNVNLLDDEMALLDGIAATEGTMPNYKKSEFSVRIYWPLAHIANDVIGVDKNGKHELFFNQIMEWLEKEDAGKENDERALSGDSDLKRLLDVLESMTMKQHYDIETSVEVEALCKQLRPFDRLNMCQIQRLEIIDSVCDFWRVAYGLQIMTDEMRFDMTPEIITEDYEKLPQREQCYHYIVYKTIDIFETYPSYRYPIWVYEKVAVHFGDKVSIKDERRLMNEAFRQLINDVTDEKTHITLKMRQAFYYLNHSIFGLGYEDAYMQAGEVVENIEGFCMSSKTLAEFFKNVDEQNLETLPPPIYERHLLFETRDGKLVDMDTFSSGEKQLLNTQSAIIYHLQNLSSIFKDPVRMKYPQVNIILEEIELYFHPEYQRSFVYSLLNLLESCGIAENITDVNILIVTHSPFILSDIPKSNVLFLKNGRPDSMMQENTFGSNIHSMLKNGFFLPSLPIGEFAYKKINGMFEKLNSANVDRENSREKEQLYSDINRIGEPYLREQLMRLFNMYYPPYYHDRPEKEEIS